MTKTIHTTNRSQAGFTLVELAVVMIIIGLLIGGVLKGQELITNAQIAATVAQVKATDGAVSAFRDKYNAIPGDMLRPDQRLPNCTTTMGSCASAGNGNGRLENAPDAFPGDEEGARFFVHLTVSDLYSGVNPTGGAVWSGIYPAAKIGGGFFAGYSTGAAADFVANGTNAMGGHYLTLTQLAVTPTAADGGGLTPNQALRIDDKVDDGNPATGAVRAFGSACTTGSGVTSTYDERATNVACGLHLRIQG